MLERSVDQAHHALRHGGEDRVVGDEQDRDAEAVVQVGHEVHDGPPVRAVEVARRLVGEDDRGVDYERACDGDALLLAARERGRMVLGAMTNLDEIQRLDDTPVDLALRDVVENEGHADVLLSGEKGEEIEGLEDVADPPAAELGGLLAAHLGDVTPFDEHRAARRRRQPGDQVEDRALPGAARPHEGPELAALDRERQVVDCFDGGVAGTEDLGDVPVLDHAVAVSP